MKTPATHPWPVVIAVVLILLGLVVAVLPLLVPVSSAALPTP